MADSHERLLDLSTAVAEGRDIEWDGVARDAAPGDIEVIRRLQIVATLHASARAASKTWGPLEIRAELGSGTFSTVYRAWDPVLEREVALKLSKHLGAEQQTVSMAEARLLAQIRHPNVVLVYGADEFDGAVGIWTELINGQTLRAILESQGPFGPEEATLIGRDICRALAAVHRAGFLHRDVKAQNVMREAGGRTVLMDFGTGDVVAGRSSELVGTPAYLAPELLQGSKPTIASDLYAVGILLYFLVSGTFPVVGKSLDELRHKHSKSQRRRLVEVRPELSSRFTHLMERTIAANPDERPRSAAEFEALLEDALRPLGAADTIRSYKRTILLYLPALLVILILLGTLILGRAPQPPPATARSSVAILPFANLSSDPENEYLSSGVTDDITAQLARLKGLRVIAGSSLGQYKVGADAVDVGKRLGVEAVVRGSLRRSGSRLRIVSQLFDARTGEQLWSEAFDRDARDLLAIQTEVSRKIATALKGELAVAEADWLTRRTGEDPEAFNLYLKGRYYWSLRSEDGFRRSLQYYNEAIARFPTYARAYAGLADTYTQLANYGLLARKEATARARETAEQAIAIDPTLAEAHAALGYVQKNGFEWVKAEESFKKAISQMPNHAPAHHWYSILLAQHGRFVEAIAESKVAISLDPLSIGTSAQLGTIFLLARHYDDAIAQYKKVLEMDPSYSLAHQVIGEAFAFKGEWETALAEFAEAKRVGALGREDHEQLADLGMTLAFAGRRQEAEAIRDELITRNRQSQPGTAANIATVVAALGKREEAMRWLTIAVTLRDPEIGYLKVDPRWDTLRDDARFVRMLAQLGLTTP